MVSAMEIPIMMPARRDRCRSRWFNPESVMGPFLRLVVDEVRYLTIPTGGGMIPTPVWDKQAIYSTRYRQRIEQRLMLTDVNGIVFLRN
jgi:hypothetical protein